MAAEPEQLPSPLTTVESRPVLRHRGACSCGWRGEWSLSRADAMAARDLHREEERAKARQR